MCATDATGDVYYLIKWQFCEVFDLVADVLVRVKNPEFVIDFYQRRSPFQRVINDRLLGVSDELNERLQQVMSLYFWNMI